MNMSLRPLCPANSDASVLSAQFGFRPASHVALFQAVNSAG